MWYNIENWNSRTIEIFKTLTAWCNNVQIFIEIDNLSGFFTFYLNGVWLLFGNQVRLFSFRKLFGEFWKSFLTWHPEQTVFIWLQTKRKVDFKKQRNGNRNIIIFIQKWKDSYLYYLLIGHPQYRNYLI